ncbi:MAG: hypothetical protein E6713_00215 [Sporomusaceae bacterium]|nr:hypothetical protein [Sporomusaceae bacterium]
MTYTEMVRQHIAKMFLIYREQNQEYIELHAKEVHRKLGFTERYPIVCNAMQQMMTNNDAYVSETESRQSSSIIIRYYLKDK